MLHPYGTLINPLYYVLDVLRLVRSGSIQQQMFSCNTLVLGENMYLNTTDAAVNFQEVNINA